ncbi:MAG TPA: DUF1330 domain-containing protein [Xanthobacteraceae bacterium]|nr:DUF1330 domain-containing protein [Xanthobacteraceae bacterium]
MVPIKTGREMPEAYRVATYHKINDPEKLAAYGKLAGPALIAAGAKFLARGMPAKVYENGVMRDGAPGMTRI